MKREYELIRSKRKTLALEVTADCRVVVRAPERCPRKTVESFVRRRQDWIEAAIERQSGRAESHPEPTPEEEKQLKARARQELPPKVEHYAAIMGLTPTGVKITSAKTRFGSCSSKNSLCFSWRLMQYPESAVDYVVVHELAHIAHKNHGREFYALIATVLPDYKARIKLLKS